MGVNSPLIYFKAVVRRVLYDLCHAELGGGGGDAELYNHNTTIMGKGRRGRSFEGHI